MKELITGLYDFDEADGAYLIKISPGRYIDLFNNLDSYPIRKRDIHQDIINYIEDCSVDIPLSQKIKIQITIRDEPYREDLEDRTRKGIRHYFLYELAVHQKRSREEFLTAGVYVLIFLVLTACTFLFEKSGIDPKSMFFKTGMQGLSIGSWVFLWEAIAGIFIKNRRHRFLIQTYRRLINTVLEFKYRQGQSFSGDSMSGELSFASGSALIGRESTGFSSASGGQHDADSPHRSAGSAGGQKKRRVKQGRYSEGRRRSSRGFSSSRRK